MTDHSKRRFFKNSTRAVGAAGVLSLFPPAIQRALAIPANRRTGTIQDVEHIVILMQENRAFDHYFGTLRGVRGFGDRFTIPQLSGRTVWEQGGLVPPVVTPFRLNTELDFSYMRVQGTPHTWPDAQDAWNHGRMDFWPVVKTNHSMGYFTEADIPFQFAMANAFTLCDSYHSAMHAGTNPNRVFHWTGSNGAPPLGNGPVIGNSHDSIDADNYDRSYLWKTYPERLQAAGIRWQVYQNYNDNFTDNPLVGFKTFRDAARTPGLNPELVQRGIGHRDLDQLKLDVLNNALPQVSWIIATAAGSEHPGPSSPAQGAEYTAKVLDALTANPEVWSKTVLIVNFDENDGFFDHMPPPAPPSYEPWSPVPGLSYLAGDSTVSTEREYHHTRSQDNEDGLRLHRPYGLGPRVPMYVLSPWSRGGWVNSQVFDHTSIIRFIEQRFGVVESNISPWRCAVCGDLMSCFNFADPNDTEFFSSFPDTRYAADRARAVKTQKLPVVLAPGPLPRQDTGVRPSRALPYDLQVTASVEPGAMHVNLSFVNHGKQAAVFHVYNRRYLARVPRRYTVEPGKQLQGSWLTIDLEFGAYDLWVLGPNGFHRHFKGNCSDERLPLAPRPEVAAEHHRASGDVILAMSNHGALPCVFKVTANAYNKGASWRFEVPPGQTLRRSWPTSAQGGWYDYSVSVAGATSFARRFAARVETGRHSISDPAMGM